MRRHDAQSRPVKPAGRSSWHTAAVFFATAIALLGLCQPAQSQEAAVPETAVQQDQWGAHFVRTAHVEGQVTIQRASEIRSEDALLNMPVIPGDRLWTGADGRAEFQLADGMLMRLDINTKLDTAALGVPGDEENDITVLRLWSGSAILTGGYFENPAKTLQVDTPAASSFILEEGLVRIDIDPDGATVVSVYRGLTEVVALDSSVLVRAGQRTVVGPGYAPEEAFNFNTTELDDFDIWSDERDTIHSANYSESYVDSSIAPYTYDLTNYGNWFYDSYYDSNCWRPYVGYGWSPYFYGYWSWYPWGYYWNSWEPWGWACYHYGSWGWCPGYGWAWVPGNTWSGGWVRWGVGDDYVGWAPLDADNRVATVTYDQSGDQGLALRENRPLTVNSPDGGLRNMDGNSWTFAKPDALSAAGRSNSYLGYDEVADKRPMKLLDSPLAVSREDAATPGPALQKLYQSEGYSGGTPEKITSSSSALTPTGRRYAIPGDFSSFSSTYRPPSQQSPSYGNSYQTPRSGGSAGVVNPQPTRRTGTRYGSTSVPQGATRERSYSKQIYNGVKRPYGSSGSSGTSRSTSSIPPRTSRPQSGTRPPTTRGTTVPPRSTARPPQRSTGRPPAPRRPSGSVGRPSAPSRPSGGSSAPSRPSGSSGRPSGGKKK